jgi:multiple sugar transport system permease protein/raffinose/stachyose/melibiose transport system permease protein
VSIISRTKRESQSSVSGKSERASRTSLQKFWHKHGILYLFILPALFLYILFFLYPFIQSFYFSLVEWDGAQAVKKFVGLNNYTRMLGDSLVWLSLRHNLIWVILGTFVPIAIGLFLAILMWGHTRGKTLFRTVYFIPQVLATVVIGFIWGWIYNPVFGILNRVLEAVGLGFLARGWLGDVHLALYAVLFAAIWARIGFCFVIFLAGLQNVDMELIDASKIDGANGWQQFWNVTLPQLSYVMTLIVTTSLIGGFSVFDIVYTMTGGGPANRTELIATYTFTKAFAESEVGYGAALSILMTLISLLTAVIFLRTRERED